MRKFIVLSILCFPFVSWSSDTLVAQLLGDQSNPQERYNAFRAIRSSYDGPIDSYNFVATVLTSTKAQEYLPLNSRIYHELIKSFSHSISTGAYSLDWIMLLTDPAIANLPPIEMIKILRWERGEHLFMLIDDHWNLLQRQTLHIVFERIEPISPHEFFQAVQLPDDRYFSDALFFEEVMNQYFIRAKDQDEYLNLLLEFLNQHFASGNLEEDQMLKISGLMSKHVKRRGPLASELEKVAIFALMRLVDDKFLSVKLDLIESVLGFDISYALDVDTGIINHEAFLPLLTKKFEEALLPNPHAAAPSGCFRWASEILQ